MNLKLPISYCTAKKMLLELLANDHLRNDKEIIKLLNDMLQPNNIEEECLQHSRIIIDSNCHIFLPEYNSKEIKMPYLSKTVYLFFLLYQEGVEFKSLYNHQEDLVHIYQIVSQEKNIETSKIHKTIGNLVEPLNNRIYEICSIIRKNLAKVVPSNKLTDYTIIGKWGGAHLIPLDRSLVIIENKDLKQLKIEKKNM